MLDLRRMRFLYEFQQRGTLAAVARAYSYSPSFISQQIATLEREAGTALLRRTGRRAQLTPQGELLATRAGEILDRMERASAELAAYADVVTGTCRIAVFQSVSHTVLPRAIAGLSARHPQLRVEIVEREPEQGLFETAAREFDLVIAEQYPGVTRPRRSGLDHVTLGEDAPFLVTARSGPLHVTTLAAGESLPWIAEPRGTASRIWLTQLCRAAGFEPDVRYETNDLVTHLRMIEAGLAVGILPQLILASMRADVALHRLPLTAGRELFSAARETTVDLPMLTVVRAALAEAFDAAMAMGQPGVEPDADPCQCGQAAASRST
ncbi:LysR substrate-binding domain-containing protein [Microbacterium sp. ASV49]|uniref:LysR substrate-binding domain-containing protein n=1 Tax=Microbacterium candidum TaxID=3041922 RepID=A0ABT7MU82_9MICO|nr:LysR substrate-binding domain-containing protein [Microbacterium sp. ASV49]MDL9978002.1 LysR substrate-binding domain-containing protein [Microbacterium sp. ASV49]